MEASGRFVGIDLGKRTYDMCLVESKGKITRTNGKTDFKGIDKLCEQLGADDLVAIERNGIENSTLIFANSIFLCRSGSVVLGEFKVFLDNLYLFFSWNVLRFGGNGLTLFLAVLPCVFL